MAFLKQQLSSWKKAGYSDEDEVVISLSKKIEANKQRAFEQKDKWTRSQIRAQRIVAMEKDIEKRRGSMSELEDNLQQIQEQIFDGKKSLATSEKQVAVLKAEARADQVEETLDEKQSKVDLDGFFKGIQLDTAEEETKLLIEEAKSVFEKLATLKRKMVAKNEEVKHEEQRQGGDRKRKAKPAHPDPDATQLDVDEDMEIDPAAFEEHFKVQLGEHTFGPDMLKKLTAAAFSTAKKARVARLGTHSPQESPRASRG
jgi:hypothetical protein